MQNEMRYTIEQYATKFKMSKEMVHSKIKSKFLNTIVENDITYIMVEQSSLPELIETTIITQERTPVIQTKQKPTVAMILALYQKENKHLKDKIMQLEEKIDQLIDDKEQMLRDEKDKIEELYTSKDAQLQNILELVNAKMMMEQGKENSQRFIVEEKEEKDPQIIELRDYLKTLDLKSSQRKTIKKRFLKVYDKDIRIMQQNGKLYLDLLKYDYSDLLEL